MSKNILGHIKKCKQTGQKLLAILLDPDKLIVRNLPLIIGTAFEMDNNILESII